MRRALGGTCFFVLRNLIAAPVQLFFFLLLACVLPYHSGLGLAGVIQPPAQRTVWRASIVLQR